MQQVLHQLDGDAVDGAEGERAQQGGQVGDVQLDKGGHDGDGELHELEDGGHRRQQGGHRDTMGLLLLSHKKHSFLMINTRKIAFQGVRIKKEHRKMPYTPSLIQTILSVPELRRFLRPQPLADYHCRWGISPRPEDSYSVVSCG